MKKVILFLVTFWLIVPAILFAEVDSCVECNVLMDGDCLADKYLPNNYQRNTKDKKEWSAYQGNWFVVGNMIGVRFRFDDESMQTLSSGGLGLEVEIVEKNGHKLKWTKVASNLPTNSNPVVDTNALDFGGDIVYAILVKNPENLSSYVDYYTWFYFESIPEGGVEIQPNLVIDVDSDCTNWHFICSDTDVETCEYFGMETDNYYAFVAYPDGRDGICWNNKNTSQDNCVPSGYEMRNDYVYIQESDSNVAPIVNVPSVEVDDVNNPPSLGCGIETTTNQEQENTNYLPDFIIKKLILIDTNGNEKYKFQKNEEVKMRAKLKNI